MKALTAILLGLGIFLFLVGVAFKVMHWPGAQVLRLVGYLLIGLFYFWRTRLLAEKRPITYAKVAAILIWSMFGASALITRGQGLVEIGMGLRSVSTVAFWLWLGILFFDLFRSEASNAESSKESLWTRMGYAFGSFAFLTGAVLKIMHWPGGQWMLIFGLVALIILFFRTTFFE